ncbi:MAG TPA: aminotransferase class V-fold PLP-dependent enzyme [Candidatus Paceibacterota bacterium]|nr:aminotransferase class V-fold PLP-dependent enzyme [Verrucomicrobiota bacterium]HRY47006.1 aminotransferase class V-fold PLP-dependent enzyme [Candidatus Paceibacterota bacterium]
MSFLADSEVVTRALAAYCQESVAGQGRVINQEPLEQIIEKLDLNRYARDGGLTGPELAAFLDRYLTFTTRLHHPAYMAHQVAVPCPTAALGSLIDGLTNNAMAIYEMGPGAASIEFWVLNWMLQKVGWQPAAFDRQKRARDPSYAGGVLTHGGSLANLTAMLAARHRAVPDVWAHGIPQNLVLLAPAGAHYSIARAAGILGLGQNAVRHLEVDALGRIIPEKLALTYDRIRQEDKRPMALVASACSTAVGIYDPLEEIGEFCRQQHLWLHVDGAHGASALLSPKHQYRLKGIELADSLTWDAHKMLQTPVLCAALLVRDHRTLDQTFEQDASYLFHDKERPGVDFAHRTIECTKAGLGLKFFMVLGALGEAGLGAFVERQYELAEQAYEYIQRQPGFECAVQPQSNILCFRRAGDDDLQLRIRDRLNAQGSFYLSSTFFGGKRYLRMALMNPHTRLEDIQKLLVTIQSM